jgi:3-oxoadipate enol-lactonase
MIGFVLPYDDVGTGPAVILLHAGIADRTMWAELVDPIAADGHRVLAVDLPGFGEAPVAPREAPWEDVLETMDALGLAQAALAGCSFGGAVALRVAVTAPERVTHLAVVSAPAPGLEPSVTLQAAWQAEEDALERGDVDAAVSAVLEAWLQPGAPPALRERVGAAQRHALETQLAAGDPDEAPDPAEEPGALEHLTMPTLVAAGEHDMPDFRWSAETLARDVPGAHAVTIFAGVGHLAPLEDPSGFLEWLLPFLRPRAARGSGG